MNEVPKGNDSDWALRPWLLAALLGIAGFLVWLASDEFANELAPWRAALTAFAFFGPIAVGFALERQNWRASLSFAALLGAIMAGIAWRVASADEHYDSAGFWLAAGIVASALALPLFQAGFHRHRWATSYKETHYHVWTDAITAGGALAFTGLSWLVLFLLSELFQAIEIDFLRDLIKKGWFGWIFSGVAFGAALGVLRNQLKVIATLQNVVLLVFSLIAVPLAVALLLFLLAVLLSGLDVLWEATRSATPLLLALAAASFVLVNAVLRDEDAAASGSRVMRIAAFVLALGILPLGILAAISTGTRIAQHGLTPERIWGLVAIVLAVTYGVAYFVSALRSRRHGWDALRQSNLHLAVATCVVALLLAMPILDFGAISTRNQLERLQAGKVSADDFDYTALRWDFGDAGREALARLAKSENGKIAAASARALDQDTRWEGRLAREARLARFEGQWIAYPEGARLPEKLKRAIISPESTVCDSAAECRVHLQPDEKSAVVLSIRCARSGHVPIESIQRSDQCHVRSAIFDLDGSEWKEGGSGLTLLPDEDKAERAGKLEAIQNGNVDIRPVDRRQIYLDDEPIGEPFE